MVGGGDRLAKSTLPQFATRDGHTPPAPESRRRLLVVVSSREMSVHAKNVISWEPARPSGPLGGTSRYIYCPRFSVWEAVPESSVKQDPLLSTRIDHSTHKNSGLNVSRMVSHVHRGPVRLGCPCRLPAAVTAPAAPSRDTAPAPAYRRSNKTIPDAW